jgi:hypothetical protein
MILKSRTKDWHMVLESVIPLRARAAKHNPWSLPMVLKRLGRTRFGRSGAKAAAHVVEDAYMLVLVAEQEIVAGRKEQARSLLDAADAAFDRKNGTR